MFLGNTRFKIIDVTNTTATTFAEKTDCTTSGKMCQSPISLAVVKPIPMDKESAAIVIFLWLNPAFATICIPDVRIVPNIMIVQPPSTDSGKDAKKLPTGGNKPAMIMHAAPVIMVKRFTTLVIATSPTFWEKDVTGGQPNKEEIADA